MKKLLLTLLLLSAFSAPADAGIFFRWFRRWEPVPIPTPIPDPVPDPKPEPKPDPIPIPLPAPAGVWAIWIEQPNARTAEYATVTSWAEDSMRGADGACRFRTIDVGQFAAKACPAAVLSYKRFADGQQLPVLVVVKQESGKAKLLWSGPAPMTSEAFSLILKQYGAQ